MQNKYAFFICSDNGYLPFLNVLLNSLHKCEINNVDVYLLYYDFNSDYLDKIKNSFNFNLIPIEIKKEHFDIHNFNKNKKNLFMKQARFHYIKKYGIEYDAICMLDADMFITTANFMNLFDLVCGTDKLIACNEKFKWIFNKRYIYDGKRIFEDDVLAHKFSCSVPIVFDLKKWMDVFDYYTKIAFNAFEMDENNNIKVAIGDMFCWNISIYKNDRQNDVILFSMPTMTQVHHTNIISSSRIINRRGVWMTSDGDEVFSIHGRIGNEAWRDWQMSKIDTLIKDGDNHMSQYLQPLKIIKNSDNTLKLIEKEWYDLNVNCKVNIYDFLPKNNYWETFK